MAALIFLQRFVLLYYICVNKLTLNNVVIWRHSTYVGVKKYGNICILSEPEATEQFHKDFSSLFIKIILNYVNNYTLLWGVIEILMGSFCIQMQVN